MEKSPIGCCCQTGGNAVPEFSWFSLFASNSQFSLFSVFQGVSPIGSLPAMQGNNLLCVWNRMDSYSGRRERHNEIKK